MIELRKIDDFLWQESDPLNFNKSDQRNIYQGIYNRII